MKKLLFLSMSVLLLISCTQDENIVSETGKVSEDLTTMNPNRGYDYSERGTYSGVIVADDTRFHGRIYLNIANNDSRNEAIVISERGDRLIFSFTEKNGAVYSFVGSRGSFDVDVSDISLVNTSNVLIDGTTGHVRLRKETDGVKNLIVLGTFDDELSIAFGLPQSFTGTWDFMVDAGSAPFISEIVFMPAGGSMISDMAADMEEADSGCSFGLTFPRHEVDAGAGLWELISVGQMIPLPNKNIVYDFTFSKGLLDFNNITNYSQGGGFMPLMNDLIFGGTLTGCNIFASHGYYLVDDNAAFIAGGAITFDTSIVPPPSPPLTNEAAIQLPRAVLAETLGEL